MSKAASKRNKFAELRALRQSGKRVFDSYEVDQVADLYEEVDEDSYKKIVRDRLNEDDFVVDDNGEGYADDGREEWDRVPVYETESEDEQMTGRGKGRKCELCISRSHYQAHTHHLTAKKNRDEEQAKRDANDRDISEYFTKGATKVQAKPKVGLPGQHPHSPNELADCVETGDQD